MSETEKPDRWQQVRDKIDRGETGDKVRGSDPAAAPLGTDQEASGTTATPPADDAEPASEDAKRPRKKGTF